MALFYMEYMWLKFCQVKADIGQDIIKYVSINEKCLIFQLDPSKPFAVLGVL